MTGWNLRCLVALMKLFPHRRPSDIVGWHDRDPLTRLAFDLAALEVVAALDDTP